MYFSRIFWMIILALLLIIVLLYNLQEDRYLTDFGYCRLQNNKTISVEHIALDNAGHVHVTRHFKKISMQTFRQQQQREFNESQRLLKNIDLLGLKNSEVLPTTSFFGTSNGSSICEGVDEQRCVPKFKSFEARLRLMPNHKIVACIIQKNMSTVLQAIICYLLDTVAFLQADRSIKTENHRINFCKRKNEMNAGFYSESQMSGQLQRLKDNWKFISISRHPVDRFLSGFVDKCVRQQNVSLKDVEFIAKEIKSFKTVHSTADSDARSFFQKRLLDSPFLMEFVVRMFYWDFKLFNYSLPHISFATAKV